MSTLPRPPSLVLTGLLLRKRLWDVCGWRCSFSFGAVSVIFAMKHNPSCSRKCFSNQQTRAPALVWGFTGSGLSWQPSCAFGGDGRGEGFGPEPAALCAGPWERRAVGEPGLRAQPVSEPGAVGLRSLEAVLPTSRGLAPVLKARSVSGPLLTVAFSCPGGRALHFASDKAESHEVR